MPEYIEREAIRNHIYALYRTKDRIPGIDIGESLILLSIDQQPAADVAPVVHGQWAGKYKSGYNPMHGVVCNKCDCWNERRSNYCPSCGAKMDG